MSSFNTENSHGDSVAATVRVRIDSCGSGKFVNYYLRVRYGC